MHDADDTILYVGKAKNLHNRVRSYFKEKIGRGPQIDKMVSLIVRFEYIVTDSELEALVLENNLIKEYSPKYNTLLRMTKHILISKVTLGEEYPRVLMVRQMKKDKAKYFGPFTNGGVRESIDLINKLYQLRTCSRNLPKDCGKERPCLNFHIGQCCAPCQGMISQEEYAKKIENVIDFLNGKQQNVIKELKEKMQQASENMDFEEAIRCRDLLESIKKVSETQKMSDNVGEDKDIIALAIDGSDTVVQVFFLRNGKINRQRTLLYDTDRDTCGRCNFDKLCEAVLCRDTIYSKRNYASGYNRGYGACRKMAVKQERRTSAFDSTTKRAKGASCRIGREKCTACSKSRQRAHQARGGQNHWRSERDRGAFGNQPSCTHGSI